MEIKTSIAVSAYDILKNIKVSDLTDEAAISIWRTIKQLRPISDEYNKEKEEVINTLKDDKFDDMQKRLTNAQYRDAKVKAGEYKLTKKDINDIQEINTYYEVFNNKFKKYLEEMNNKLVDININKIPGEELIKVIKSEGKSFNDIEVIDFLFD